MAALPEITTLDEFEDEYRKGAGTILPSRASKLANLDNIRRAGDGSATTTRCIGIRSTPPTAASA